MKDLGGKVAFITGGGSGIGFGIAKCAAEAGMKVAIADVRADHLEQGLAKLRAAGAQAHGMLVDVADAAAVERAAEETIKVFGKVHLVCNNAGVSIFGPMDAATMDDWRWIMGVNVDGVINGIQSFMPRLKAHGEGGHIVNTASMAGLTAAGQITSYVMTKHAIVGLSLALRSEAVPRGVGVLAVCPGAVETPILDKGAIGGFVGRDYYLRGQGMKAAYSADRLARDTLKAIARNKALLVAPKQAYASWVFARLAPGLLQRLSIRFIADQRARQAARAGR